MRKKLRKALKDLGPAIDKPAWADVLGEPTGLLYFACYDETASSLTLDAGIEVLRHFLTDRAVIAPMRRAVTSGGEGTVDFSRVMGESQSRIEEIAAIGKPRIVLRAFGDLWDEHEALVDRDRGRELLGLKTGVPELDHRTKGLRGLMLLGGRPGAGKTALAAACAIGACKYHAANDAVVLFVSLEMDRNEIMSRVKSFVSDLPWCSYRKGSNRHGGDGSKLGDRDRAALARGRRQAMTDMQLEKRLYVLGRNELGALWDASDIIDCAARLKAK